MTSPELLIKAIGDSPMPPVDKWNPDYCGELDLVLKADGQWLYHGTPFTRQRMVLLFSRVIKKENEQFFLVTPVEKLGITVEWMPFVIHDFEWIEENKVSVLCLTDNCENTIKLTSPQQLAFSQFDGQNLPIIQVRNNLFASFSRASYYRLIENATIVQKDDIDQFVIQSNNLNFIIGECPIE